MKNEFTLGLDIGIGSVGYGIMSDDYNIVDCGVRLFESADASENVKRRGFRQARRLKRRHNHRIKRTEDLLKLHNIYKPDKLNNDVLSLKLKGFTQKLEEGELYQVLINYVKRRGVSYLDDLLTEDTKSTSDFEKSLKINKNLLENKLPSEIQKERLSTFGKYRGETISEDSIYRNIYTCSSYKEEILKILNKNKEFYSFINEDFIDSYLKIFEDKRKYYIGPGNKNSRTKYGIYTLVKNEDGKYVTLKNIFSTLIGKCSVYEDEFRASKFSYTAQKFNLLNDLNNLTIDNRKITPTEKTAIIDKIINSQNTNVMKIISEVCNVEHSKIKGFRIDKNEKPEFHKFEYYKKLLKKINESNVDMSSISTEDIDKIAGEITLATTQDAVLEAMHDLNYSKEIANFFAEFRVKNSSCFNGWHSYSLKIMNQMMYKLENTSLNGTSILFDDEFKHLAKDNISKYKELKFIPEKSITDEIFNPVVTRSIHQTIKIINELVKKYGNFKAIVIEMPREDNDKNEKKSINEIAKYNNNLKKLINTKLSSQFSIILKEEDFYHHKNLKLKLKLWYQQEGICLYSGKTILPSDIIHNPDKFEIDHIIPLSISFDDSQNNKVLVLGSENALKSNKTAYYYLDSKNGNWNLATYKAKAAELLSKKLIGKQKYKNLINDCDILKEEVIKGFISRNLNDTRYSSRVVLNSLQDFIKAKELDTKVKVVTGSYTSQFRKKLKLDKDRDLSHAHHGIDALICALSDIGFNKYKIATKDIIDFESGEILNIEKYNKMSSEEQYNELMFAYNKFDLEVKLKKAETTMKYSYKIDKKANRSVSNNTIYSVRKDVNNEYMTMSKIKNIYEPIQSKDMPNFLKRFTTDKEKLLVYHNDKETWKKIESVINNYPPDYIDETGKNKCVNPFIQYKQEYGYLTKYSKKNNGPNIYSLQYYDNKLGNHIDLTKNYNQIKNEKKVVLLSINPYRTDVYINKNAKNQKDTYKIVRMDYNDFKFTKNNYELKIDVYNKKCEERGINENYEFMFTLHKNDFISFEYDDKLIECRACGGETNGIGSLEIKPIEKKDYTKPDGKRIQKYVSFSKIKNLQKINVDILGNRHITTQEKLKLNIDLY